MPDTAHAPKRGSGLGFHITPELWIPLEIVVERSAILAQSGAGKTNAGRVIVEHVLDAKQQVVILDPPGAWWGLRSTADGKKPAYAIPVFGGDHGDVPLDPKAGALLADLAVNDKLPMIIDLSHFTAGEHQRFATDFMVRFYEGKGRQKSPVLFVAEEADEIAPERPRSEQARMVGASERIAKRGRGRGIGSLWITQRSASFNKNPLSQIQLMFAMLTSDPRDVGAIDDWMKRFPQQEYRQQVLRAIGTLQPGEAFIWSPSWLKYFGRITFPMSRTFDSGATPKVGMPMVQPEKLAAIDLKALGKQMAAMAEEAQAKDPAELQKRVAAQTKTIADLERRLASAKPEVKIETKVERVEVPVIPDEALKALRDGARLAQEAATAMSTAAERISQVISGAQRLVSLPPAAESGAKYARNIPAAVREAKQTVTSNLPRTVNRVEGVTAPQQRILDALASFEALGIHDVERSNVAVFSDQSSWSSGFANNLGALRTAGYIDYPAGGRVCLTDTGRSVAGEPWPIESVEQLHRAWYAKLPAPQCRILGALIDRYPRALSRDELAERSSQSPTSSGFANNLGALRSLGLITYPARGEVAATALLFPEGVPA